MKSAVIFISLFVLYAVWSPSPAAAQGRDYFTAEEVELIRDAQEIDKRVDILTRAIDRRFAVLKIDVPGAKASGKSSDKWGELPTGSRVELLADIKNILQKAIDDIDSLAERPNSATLPFEGEKKPKGFSELFPKAVRNLAAAAKRYEPALKIELDAAKDTREKGLIADTIDMCTQIVEAQSKLSAEAPKKNAKGH